MRKNNGITLIALVITIIILIILAGITINLLFGNMGLLSKSQNAAGQYSEAAAKEKLEIELATLYTDKFMKKEYNENEYIDNKLAEKDFVVNENKITVDGWQFLIDREELKIVDEIGKELEGQKINLVQNGVTNTDVLGDWIVWNPDSTGGFSQEENRLHLSTSFRNTRFGMVSSKTIDVTNINSLKVNLLLFDNGASFSSSFTIGFSKNNQTDSDSYFPIEVGQTVSIEPNAHSRVFEICVDTTDLEGEYYLKMLVTHGSEAYANNSEAYIYNIYTE